MHVSVLVWEDRIDERYIEVVSGTVADYLKLRIDQILKFVWLILTMIGEDIIRIVGCWIYCKLMIKFYVRNKKILSLYSQLTIKELTVTDIDGSISLDKRLSVIVGWI